MNILDFDKWYCAVNEGFKADVNNDDENTKKDEIEVEAPNEGNDIVYTVDGDSVKTKKKIVSKDDKGNIIETKYSDEIEIDDIKLKKDVINAVDAIDDIKQRERAKEILRLTGGDDTNIKKDIIKIFDDPNSKFIRRRQTTENGGTIEYKLFDIIKNENEDFWDTKGEYCYINIKDIDKKYGKNEEEIDTKEMYNITSVKTVGRGEYLLPLLYHDVYKEQVYGQNKYNHDKFSIGDNFIYKNDTNEDKYFLEVKAPNAVLPFIISDKLRKNNKIIKYNENDNTIKDNYKTAIATSFLTYAKKQNKNRKDLYFCIFNEDDNKTPIGMLFINLSNISDDDIDPNNTPKTDNDIIEKIKNLIDVDINDNTSSKATFKYTLKCDKNNEPIIKCNIHKDYIKQNKKDKMKEESLILSRDNFINEYYTNK
jgi:hypothetical protein